ncbi:MAG: MOSC domain-containing protein [Anaerolineaceae bacterium]|nr:MOSC domain-containing protein [Anaerolineaceae bacterium]
MQLHSVNVGVPVTVPARGGLLRTGIYKRPVTGRVRLGPTNLEGDGQADLQHHGGPHQAVYAYSRDHYAWWAQQLERDDLTPGHFGENLTIGGLDEDAVCIGDVWRVGETLLQVSQPRIPCHKLAHRMGLPGFVRTFTQSERCGCYLRVLQTGKLGAGDRVSLTEREEQPMSVRAIFRLRLLQPDDPAATAHASQLPGLSPEWREYFAGRRLAIEARA